MPIAHKTAVPQDFLDQMRTNLTKRPDDSIQNEAQKDILPKKEHDEKKADENPSVKASAEKARKSKYADVMNIRLSEGRRDEIKKFCTNCGVTVTQYIESSFEFLSREVAAGNIVISKGGITKVEN